MSSSTLFFLSLTLFVFIRTAESVNNIYSYDDGKGGEEHCCIVRTHENYCLATPITRSLIQMNKQCHQFDGPKQYRSKSKKKNDAYEDKILRRLDVKSSEEVGDQLLFELKTPLTTDLLHKDLICLKSTKHNIDLNRCYLELPDEINNESDDEHELRKHYRRQQQRRRQRNHRKRVHRDISDEDEYSNNDFKSTEESMAEKEVRRSELHQPVRIREGQGIVILQTYTVNLTRIEQTYGGRDRCVSWYRKQTRKIRHNSGKHTKFCRKLNDHMEDCVKHLLFSDTEPNHHSHNTITSLVTGSKLYCEEQTGVSKLLGIHQQGILCLQDENKMIIEQKFSDLAGLSDLKKNQDVFEFIDGNAKFQAEFDHDCHNSKTLVEIDAADKENQVKIKQTKARQE